jgi:HK97 family phage major capsid protein
MPSIGAGSKPIAFGDFSFYTIVMREGISIKTLTETLPSLNDVGYLAYEFLDGKLVRPEAIKVLQMSA